MYMSDAEPTIPPRAGQTTASGIFERVDTWMESWMESRPSKFQNF